MATLIIYYSQGGNTELVAKTLAQNLRADMVRIHDLKTGITPAHFEQLMIYAAMFCLEYGHNPEKITMELRLYQNDEVLILEPDPRDICDIMETIVRFDKLINKEKQGVEYYG